MRPALLSICVLAACLSCNKNPGPGPSPADHDPSVTFPNRVGDSWKYLVNDTTMDLSNNPTSISQYYMDVTIIDSIILPPGRTVKVWVYSMPGQTDTNYVYQSNDTLYYADRNNFFFPKTGRRYIVPVTMNQSWDYTYNGYEFPPSPYIFTKVDSTGTVTIGQHTFNNALRLNGNAGRPDEFYQIVEWDVNNIGIVKRYFKSAYNLPFQKRIEWKLVEYTIL